MNGSELGNQLLLGSLFILGGLFGVLFWVMPMLSRRGPGIGIPGALKIKKHRYSYEMGDMLLRFGGASTFAGMDIHLPKRLPHIYLDAYANDHRGRPEFVFAKEDTFSLEGGFDEHFKAYTLKQHRGLAKSILSHEVLQAFAKTAYKYDIEIMEDHVRLLVFGAPVSGNEQMQQELVKAAKVIMKEVDHRLQSWNGLQ